MLVRIIFLLASLFSGALLAETSAVRVLNTIKYKDSHASIIGQHEWKELQLDRLISELDRTKTSFGRWGLTYLLQPIADEEEITQRQRIIQFLLENDDVLQHLQKQLSVIKKYEKSLLAYWDREDQLDSSCKQFYFNMPFVKKYLNESSLALNFGVAAEMFDSARGLFFALCMQGISDEMYLWMRPDNADGANKNQFDIMRGIKRGLKEPLRQHTLSLDVLKGRENDDYYGKDVLYVDMYGTFGDRYHLYSHGYNLGLSLFGSLFGLESVHVKKTTNFFEKGCAFLGASTRTLIYDYFWGLRILNITRAIRFMYSSLKDLTHRVNDVVLCCDAVARIVARSHNYSHVFGQYLAFDQKRHGKGMGVMVDVAKKYRDHETLYQYSGGHILLQHREFKREKSSFVPVLQMIAFLDAYCSIAQLMKEHEHTHNKFCFVNFVNETEPYIAYEDAWLALLPHDQAVANDLYLGGRAAGKMVITGPNGGGKSTILKAYGDAAVLAQGWGIVPGSRAEQTVLHGIKTGLAPHEDLQQGLSTFMAEKKCMEQLDSCIKRSHKHNNILVLVDEPYKGTVDEESAKRIYQFGIDSVLQPHTLLCIATHVKKPIFLEPDTKGIFANYHIEITEDAPGEFTRLFKLKQGPANWWFENEEQRGRFVDWISVLLEEQSKGNKAYSNIMLGR